MFLERPAQILALIRDSMAASGSRPDQEMMKREIRKQRMINIGGRPVLMPRANQTVTGRGRERVKIGLAFASTYLIWGSTYLAIHYAVETIPPLVAVGIRNTIAGAILLGWAWARGFRPRRENWTAGFIIGGLFFLVNHGSLNWAEQYVGSGLAALLIATEPMFILVLAAMTGQQRISRVSAMGLGLGAVGVTILTAGDFGKGSTFMGVLAVLMGSLAWAGGVVISPKVKLPEDAIARTAVPLACGAILVWIVGAATGELQSTHWASISLRSMSGLAYLIFLGSIVAFTSYMWLLQRCPPALVATHTYANPVVAVLLGWLLASEPLTSRTVIASIAILGAIVLIRRGERTTTTSASGEMERILGNNPEAAVIERVS
jgi:drug/metabolite transporter (DMT)-like permease